MPASHSTNFSHRTSPTLTIPINGAAETLDKGPSIHTRALSIYLGGDRGTDVSLYLMKDIWGLRQVIAKPTTVSASFLDLSCQESYLKWMTIISSLAQLISIDAWGGYNPL